MADLEASKFLTEEDDPASSESSALPKDTILRTSKQKAKIQDDVCTGKSTSVRAPILFDGGNFRRDNAVENLKKRCRSCFTVFHIRHAWSHKMEYLPEQERGKRVLK